MPAAPRFPLSALLTCLLAAALSGCGQPEVEPWRASVSAGAKSLHSKQYEQAAVQYRQALAQADAAGSPKGRRAAVQGLAMSVAMSNKLAAAEAHYMKLLELQRQSLEADSLSGLAVARTLGSLAEISLRLGRVDRADSCWSEVLRLGEAGLVDLLPEDRTIAYTLNGLSKVSRSRGDTVRADSLAELALGMQVYAFGFENYIGDELEKAEQLYHEARGRFESQYGPDHELVAIAHRALGRLYQYQGRRAEAADQYRRAVSSYEGAGAGSIDLAWTLEDLAGVLDGTRADEAARLRRRAAALRQGRRPSRVRRMAALAAAGPPVP